MFAKVTIIIQDREAKSKLAPVMKEVQGMINMDKVFTVIRHPQMIGCILVEAYLAGGQGMSWTVKSTLEDFEKIINPPGLNPSRLI